MTAASEYVAYGMALVAIPIGRKGPITPGWNKEEDVITDPDSAASLTGNVGIAHAYCWSSPTMALDIDDLPKAHKWLEAHGIDLDALLNAGDAVQIVSGKEGRAKLLYRLPEGLAPVESLTIKEKVVVEGEAKQITTLEFRCATRDGLTVQDVLPPSIHPDTGQPYRWGGKGDWRNIPVITDDLLTLWRTELASQTAHRQHHKNLATSKHGVDDTPRKRAHLNVVLTFISADCTYELYRDMVWAILSLGWHDSEGLAKAWCLTAPHRFEEDDFWNVANSFDASRTPTMGTIIYYARAGGWNG